MKHLISHILLFAATIAGLRAQLFQRFDIPVTVAGKELTSAWAGGVNAPQWSAVDLDNDGKQDLYAFDRDGNMHLTFLNIGEEGEVKYEFAPQFLANFPFTNAYVLLRDYNHDGAMDLFACSKDEGVQGVKVFKGKFENNQLAFDRLIFDNWLFQVLTVPSGGGIAQLYVAEPDYPAIDDIDGDGDLDILSMNSVSANLVTFFKNMSVENGQGPDTLIFKSEDYCWGKFLVPAITDSFVLSCYPDSCYVPCFNRPMEEEVRQHGSSSLAVFDNDNDGDMEILYGDLLYPKIIYGENGGTTENAWMTSQDPFFPNSDNPVWLPHFPASFFLDLDNDGLTDYIASPNKNKSAPDRDVWFYKNYGSNEFPNFQLLNNKALVDDMIDLGSGAQPAFFDYDADGLLDLVVGNFSEFTMQNPDGDSYLMLFKNTGTASEPAFELVDGDWLGLKQFSATSSAYAPAFGDLDQDGDKDLVIGEREGRLFFLENTAGPGLPATWATIDTFWQNIIIGPYSTPFIYDLNKDGLPDLLVGERAGNINFMPNQGSAGSPVFHPNPDQAPNVHALGGISTQAPFANTGYSSPVVLDFGDTVYIASGSERGFIELYMVEFDKLDGDTFLFFDKKFGNLREGFNSHIAFADLNGDTMLDAVVGNERGGLGVFSSPFTVQGEVSAEETVQEVLFQLFPVPTGDRLYVKINADYLGDIQYAIVDPLGRQIMDGSFSGEQNSIGTSGLAPGIYFFKMQLGQKSMAKAFVKQ